LFRGTWARAVRFCREFGSIDGRAHWVAHTPLRAPAGRRQIDWTGEVRNDRLPETNFMRRPTSIVRDATEPLSAIEPRNRARRNFGKYLPPRTTISPWATRRT